MQPNLFEARDAITDPLYVITTIFNPVRFSSRWKHYKAFEKRVLDAGAHLVLIEATLGNRPAISAGPVHQNHQVIHVSVKDEIWLKENLINVAIQHLPKDWKYVAWVDADLAFCRPDWVQETLQQLQHHPIVQMFSEVANLGPHHEVMSTGRSFVATYLNCGKVEKKGDPDECYMEGIPTNLEWMGAPGGAWAARRETIDCLGGLIDFVIMGSADYYMAICLVGYFELMSTSCYDREYVRDIQHWQDNALRCVDRNVGLVKGTVLHYWHGKFKNRGYDTRWQILAKYQFNPRTDLRKDGNGVYMLIGGKWQMRDELRHYFRQRNEDSIDI